MKILIVGATGLIGKEVGKKLVRAGHHLVVISRNSKKAQAELPFPCDAVEGDLEKGLIRDPRILDVDVVIDPIGVTRPVKSQPTKGVGVSFEEAVSSGAAYLGNGWRWVVGVDISATHRDVDELPSRPVPKSLPLRRPYLDPSEAATPLRHTQRARGRR